MHILYPNDSRYVNFYHKLCIIFVLLFYLQALSSFSSALQSGQLGPLMSQFGLGEDVANAAAQGGRISDRHTKKKHDIW